MSANGPKVPAAFCGWGHGGKGCAPRKWVSWSVFIGVNPPCTGSKYSGVCTPGPPGDWCVFRAKVCIVCE